jgi:hypothetical protein
MKLKQIVKSIVPLCMVFTKLLGFLEGEFTLAIKKTFGNKIVEEKLFLPFRIMS